MPPKEKQPKKNPRGKKKRKNISPLSTDTTQKGDHTAQTGLDSGCVNNDHSDSVGETVSKQTKRFHPSSPEYFVFDSTAMNYSQPSFQSQMLQSPQGQFNPSYMTTPITSSPHTAPPPWAISIMDDIKNIKSKVDKIDNIEKSINSISSKLSDLESKVGSVDKRVADVERTCGFVSDQFDEQSKKLKAADSEIKKLQESCNNMKRSMDSTRILGNC